MSKVSILVPIYNVEDYIERCARSLFEQTYPDIEYIFADDCSADRSIPILKKVIDEYPSRKTDVTIIHHATNRGLAASRNTGIDNSSSEFVMFVDSDDWLEPDAVEQLLLRQQSTNADIVFGYALMHYPGGTTLLSECDYASKHEMMLCYSRFTPGYTMTLWKRLLRRSLLIDHDLREFEGLNYAEDKHLLTKAAYYATSFRKLDKVVYHYNRENDKSLVAVNYTSRFNIDAFRQESANLQAIVDFFKEKNEAEYYRESSIALLKYLKGKLGLAMEKSSPRGFRLAIDLINATDPQFWPVIGWDRNAFHRWLYGNYHYMKYSPYIKRPAKRLVSKLKK